MLRNRWGNRITRNNFAAAVARLARGAGIARRMTPHTLRHAAITAALNLGAHLRDVQDFTRHADPKAAMRYDRNRHSLDRHATYAIAQYIAGSEERIRAFSPCSSRSRAALCGFRCEQRGWA